MGCLFVILGGLFPRVAFVCLWIFTNDVDRAYDSFIVPLLGLIFLPLTALVYAVEWLWVALAFVLDLSSDGGGDRARRGGD